MAISVRWDQVIKDALIISFDGNWTWQDFYDASDHAHRLMGEARAPVHIIYELAHSTTMFKNPMLHLRHFAVNAPGNTGGLHVYIGASAYWQACVTTFNRVYPQLAQEVVVASSLEEARTALHGRREVKREATQHEASR
ncbi:MAG: hypothetical protein IH587_00330, partial [Anaerolineae bacterium]|nr:hypothetical protein [Anaerolineae bacterium]